MKCAELLVQFLELRAGSNFTNGCKFIRHLAESPECRYCGAEVEDEIHVIESCNAYGESRVKIVKYLEELLMKDFSQMTLSEISCVVGNLRLIDWLITIKEG
ncbi:unnamed protein product [Blepharisma stoltei]|uniref:Reverse transcriptase zinc-binding domain-containing protein n=1 Tax=Blepharisma stoltei TaxID=1481888 RepID=A0AAU9IY63_9CILI|nr:unnamed protein product [Blepharisma stoltei]